MKAEQEVATFADLEAFAAKALEHDSVRAYYAERWTHLLIDEAQDTNPVQWRILSALMTPDVNLTVVGDEKQGIYAFRRADVAVFREAQQAVLNQGGQVIPMSRSFRTHAPLLAVINAYFTETMTGPSEERPTAARFEPLEAHREKAPGEEPAVELHFLQGDSAGEVRAAEARYLAARVQAMLLAGLPVHDRKTGQIRPVRLSDITLLLRVRTDLKLYEDAFQAAGLPVVVHGGRGLLERAEVLDAVSLLSAVADPTEDVSLAAVLRSPYGRLSDQELLELAGQRAKGETLWGTLERTGEYADFVQWLWNLRRSSLSASASAVVARANAQRGTDLIHAALPDGARRTENLRRFQAYLRQLAAEGQRDVVSVVQRIRQQLRLGADEAEAISPAPNALKIMTIHGSKGLEFPVVIYADALREGGGMEPVIRFDTEHGLALKLPDLEQPLPDWTRLAELGRERSASESERVTYVAMTRAADYLILSVPANGRSGVEKQAQFAAAFPQKGVARFYAQALQVSAPLPLPLREVKGRLQLDVRSGPGVILPGVLPVTAMKSYLTCPRQFAFRYMEGQLPLAELWDPLGGESETPRRAAGRSIGDAVHLLLEGQLETQQQEVALAHLLPEDRSEVLQLVQAFSGEPFAAVNTLTMQHEMPVQVAFEGLTFEGVVDAYDEASGLILDYKTDRRKRPEEHLPQLALYAHQLGASQAALAYLRHGELVTFGSDTLQVTLTQLAEATDRMKALDFHPEPSPEKCGWCTFRGVCDAAWRMESPEGATN